MSIGPPVPALPPTPHPTVHPTPHPGSHPGSPSGPAPAPARSEPRPRTASTAAWSLVLAVLGLLLAPLLAGALPALVALLLADAADREIQDSQGWLTGHRLLGWTRWLARAALVVACVVGAVLLVRWLLAVGSAAGDPGYPDTVD